MGRVRTSIVLPPELHAWAKRRARERRVSFGQVVRDGLLLLKRQQPSMSPDDDPVYHPIPLPPELAAENPGPPDLARNHDKYLYGPR